MTIDDPIASDPTAGSEVPSGGGHDLDHWLSEFDRTSKDKPSGGGTVGGDETSPQPDAPTTRPRPEPPRAVSDSDMMMTSLRVAQQQVWWNEMMTQQHFAALRKQEEVDFAEVLSVAKDQLDGMRHLPDDFARRWLVSEYNLDKELMEAWDNRYEDEGATNHARAVVRRALKKMVKAAREVPTPEDLLATDDRAMVTAAVRGASTKAPSEQAPDFAGMSNAQYREEHKKRYGYFPSV